MKRKKYQAVPNVRFWVWWNNGWVKLTLGPLKELSLYKWSRHDEGWSSELVQYNYDQHNQGVLCFWRDDGCDCDGRLTTAGNSFCPFSQLESVPAYGTATEYFHNGRRIHRPNWQKCGSDVVYDEYAQAAGY